DAFPNQPGETGPTCRPALEELRTRLTSSEALDVSREVYKFLGPLWQSLPVEDTLRTSRDDTKKGDGGDWREHWPLTPSQRKAVDDDDYTILRDWARMAEDLIALQIVRWFAPALSHLLPMMQYVVLASISLLLAVTSYPFDHQGWLTTMMVCL